MRIYGKCKTCTTEISFWSFAETRVDLALQSGDYKKLYCSTCGKNNRFHLNELYAKKSKIAQFIALTAIVIGLGLLWYYFVPIAEVLLLHIGGIILVPFSIYQIIHKQEEVRVKSFNLLT